MVKMLQQMGWITYWSSTILKWKENQADDNLSIMFEGKSSSQSPKEFPHEDMKFFEEGGIRNVKQANV